MNFLWNTGMCANNSIGTILLCQCGAHCAKNGRYNVWQCQVVLGWKCLLTVEPKSVVNVGKIANCFSVLIDTDNNDYTGNIELNKQLLISNRSINYLITALFYVRWKGHVNETNIIGCKTDPQPLYREIRIWHPSAGCCFGATPLCNYPVSITSREQK